MANSKDIRLKKFKIVFGWILALAIVALSFWAYNIIEGSRGYACSSPNSAAQADLRNLLTVLEAHYADYQRYPSSAKLISYTCADGVTASFVTSHDGQSFYAMAFNTKKGSRLYFSYSNSPLIWWIPFPKQGLVTAEPL